MQTGAFLLALALLGFVAYVWAIHGQIRHMREQLEKRKALASRQPLSLALLSRQLNLLAAQMNDCLQQEQNAKAARQRQERQSREMIAHISHDLRTPLTASKGYLQLLEQDLCTQGQREKLAIIQKHMQALENLVGHFWEYSYLLTAEREPDLQTINLTNLIAECLAEQVALLEKEGLRLAFENDGMIFISGAPDHLHRIVQNLIQNGIRHAAGDIAVSLSRENQQAVLCFSNPVKSGVQIDAAQIFDGFYMADTARGQTGGLGLSIVKLLTLQMGGGVSALFENGILQVFLTFPEAREESPKLI